jgi:hypothetical protein
MLEEAQTGNQIYLHDGAYVKLDLKWHNNPVFIADAVKHGMAFNVAGEMYDGRGNPLSEKAPKIVSVSRSAP